MRFQEIWGEKGGRMMGFIIGSMDLQYSNTHRIEDKFVQNLILMLIPSSGHKIGNYIKYTFRSIVSIEIVPTEVCAILEIRMHLL